MMRTTIAKGCLYCGLRLPDTADFCPECGRPTEVATRVDNEVKMMRTAIVKGCLYCGLQFSESVDFCPQCVRPIEKVCVTCTTEESGADRFLTEIAGKDDLVRQQEASSDYSEPLAHETTRIRDEREDVHLIDALTLIATRNG